MSAAGYAIDGGQRAKQRLDLLAAVMEPFTASLLRDAGVVAGNRCLDVGCGGGHVSRQLARLVGPRGRVVGIDVDAEVLALARTDADAEGLGNVEFRVGDAVAIDDGPYDVAYARFLLSHLADPARALSAMVTALTPGGLVIIEDVDFRGCFCHPDCHAYQRYVELYREAVRRRGGNADIGPRLPSLLRMAGGVEVTVDVCQPAELSGDVKLMTPLTLERIAQSVINEGVATDTQFEQTVVALRRYHDDPTTLMSLPRIVRAWARRPYNNQRL